MANTELDKSKIYCPKCGKTMAGTNFYTLKNGQKVDLCKGCLTMHVNNWDPETFLWILEKFDVPYLPWEWNKLLDEAYRKDPYKITGMSVLGKYLRLMKLKQHQEFGYADSERLQAEHTEVIATNSENLNTAESEASVKAAYENGEISKAQFETYQHLNAHAEPAAVPLMPMSEAPIASISAPAASPAYPVNDHPYEVVQLEDMSKYLTEDDKRYMALKWGIFYTAEQWIKLEKLYIDFTESYTIENAGTIDTLKQICKLSLKCNEALDSGDVDSYAKLSRQYDALMKSAKFTEAQNKEGKVDAFDSVGSIVLFCEKNGGKIPKYEIKADRDVIDTILNDNKKYLDEVIKNDPNIENLIEDHIKKMELQAKFKEEERIAKERILNGAPAKTLEELTEEYDEFAEKELEDLEKDRRTQENDE